MKHRRETRKTLKDTARGRENRLLFRNPSVTVADAYKGDVRKANLSAGRSRRIDDLDRAPDRSRAGADEPLPGDRGIVARQRLQDVYCRSVGKFAAVNALYARYFPRDSPARIFVCVPAWPGHFDVEIECIAAV